MMNRARISVSLAAVLLLATAAPALGGGPVIVGRERYSGSDSFTYDDCGFEVSVEAEFSGFAQIRTGVGKDDDAFFAHDNYSYTETHTNVATGEFFTIVGNGLFQETRATRVEGSVFEFTAIDAGQVFTVFDSDGNMILRDRGVIQSTILFDTEGDDVPGGIFLAWLDVHFGGPHPGAEFDFCAALD